MVEIIGWAAICLIAAVAAIAVLYCVLITMVVHHVSDEIRKSKGQR